MGVKMDLTNRVNKLYAKLMTKKVVSEFYILQKGEPLPQDEKQKVQVILII